MSKTPQQIITEIDSLVNEERWKPWAGYDPPNNPMGALQQSRTELFKFIEVLHSNGILESEHSSCLQLGLGPSGVSQSMWRTMFHLVLTIDERACLLSAPMIEDKVIAGGVNTHSAEARRIVNDFVIDSKPFDLLFIDAGHEYTDVRLDHMDYAQFVRPGGVIAFHDACKRSDIPAHQIWQYLKDEYPTMPVIDDDGIGIAWYVR